MPMISTQKDTLHTLFTQAHADFQKGLIARASFKVHDPALGEDLVQDTFMKTWKYIVKGGKIHIMKAFLYHVLNGLIIDEYRKKKTTSLDSLIEKGFEPHNEESPRLTDILDGKTATLLIERLPEKYREVMSLRYVRLLSLREIAHMTGQSTNTVAVQTHRGLEKLKALYNHE